MIRTRRQAASRVAAAVLGLAAWLGAVVVPSSPASFAAASEAPAPQSPERVPARHVVLVSIDGLMPDDYLKADELGLRVPTLRGLMREGAYARGVVGVLPTVTYPSHTTLITGVPPRLHGIDANTVFDPEGRSDGAWRWFARDVRVPTLVSAARARWLTTAALSWPVSVGLEADFNVPEFWRPGSSHEVDLQLLEELSTPRLLLAAVADARGRPLGWPLTDGDRADAAIHLLRAQRPHLLLLHFIEVDGARHEHGPRSAQARAAVEAADAHLRRVLDALAETGLAARTLVAVASDHGFLPVTHDLRPNALLREAGLVRTDERGRVEDWRAFFQSHGGSAALRLREPGDGATLARVRALFEARLREPGSGLRAILGPQEVAAYGGSEAWPLVLDAREGYYFSAEAAGEWVTPSKRRGAHGHAPDRPGMEAALLVTAPGLKRRGDLGVVRMTSIAPTLARWLGVELSARADSPLPLFE